ncbi:MAG: sigma-54-dependent Fis family transcriptional regulator [Bacteroidia bacterium]|nr:sigma-54-dependent Fis family transcriptional regulator [Bacteroidia bacterium]
MDPGQSFSSERPLNIFVVEDDLWYGELLVHHLSLNPDNHVKRFENAAEVLAALPDQADVITLDYSLPDMRGDELLRKITSMLPEVAVIVISGQEDISTALNLLRQGAYDYFVKNDETKERLWNAVNNIRKNVALQYEVRNLREQIGYQYDLQHLIIGSSEQMKKVFSLITKAAGTNINVSVSGETGTGKELVAKAIHHNSSRAGKPFMAVNVASIPKDLLESELFGHEKGAFTGAIQSRPGKFEEAAGGTLFLDEIADLDFALQVKLLRVLQEREVTRLGSNRVIPIDVRIITATHKNLADEVRVGLFREDLFYRILGLPVHLPPLRERGNDILLLAKHFLDSFCSSNKLHRKSFSVQAREKLLAYRYPGNVRELKAVVELAAVMTDHDQIDADDISFTAARTPADLLDQDMTLEEFNHKIIRHYLDRFDNNVIEVARRLDIGKSTIYRMMKEGKI